MEGLPKEYNDKGGIFIPSKHGAPATWDPWQPTQYGSYKDIKCCWGEVVCERELSAAAEEEGQMREAFGDAPDSGLCRAAACSNFTFFESASSRETVERRLMSRELCLMCSSGGGTVSLCDRAASRPLAWSGELLCFFAGEEQSSQGGVSRFRLRCGDDRFIGAVGEARCTEYAEPAELDLMGFSVGDLFPSLGE